MVVWAAAVPIKASEASVNVVNGFIASQRSRNNQQKIWRSCSGATACHALLARYMFMRHHGRVPSRKSCAAEQITTRRAFSLLLVSRSYRRAEEGLFDQNKQATVSTAFRLPPAKLFSDWTLVEEACGPWAVCGGQRPAQQLSLISRGSRLAERGDGRPLSLDGPIVSGPTKISIEER